jgi:hypothetical protein
MALRIVNAEKVLNVFLTAEENWNACLTFGFGGFCDPNRRNWAVGIRGKVLIELRRK